VSDRHNLPSASGAERYDLCRASFLMEQEHGEKDTDTAEASMGTRIHAALAGEAVALTAEEEAIAEKARDIEARALAEYFGSGGNSGRIREERLWYRDPLTLTRSWSGQPDLVAIEMARKPRAAVVDYKSLWGTHAEAPSNLQLRCLAVLVAVEYGIENVRVILVQPNGWPKYTVADYGPQELRQAEDEIAALMEDVQREGHPRTPSAKACRYCRARHVCPEAIAAASAVATLPREGTDIALPPEAIAAFLDRIPLVESVVEAVKAKAKRMLEADPNAIPGWRLKPGTEREKITDIGTVFSRFTEAGGNQEQFTSAVSITKSALTETVRSVTGLKGKALNAKVADIVAGCVTTTTTAPSLEKGDPK
jgi:hypothetical protein